METYHDSSQKAYEVITGTKAKEADRYAIDVLKIPSLNLMENASRSVQKYIAGKYPKEQVLVLSGVGNNGADGLCIARLLIEENGIVPDVGIIGNLEHASWEFLYQLSMLKKVNGHIFYISDKTVLPDASVLVDAVFGIGLKTEIRENYRTLLLQAESKHYSHVIAVDIPSGINADTGELLGAGLHAEATITFGRVKTGLLGGAGKDYAGEVILRNIGIPDEAYFKVQ